VDVGVETGVPDVNVVVGLVGGGVELVEVDVLVLVGVDVEVLVDVGVLVGVLVGVVVEVGVLVLVVVVLEPQVTVKLT